MPGLSNHETSNYFSNYQDVIPSSTLLLDLGKWSTNGLFNFYEDFNKAYNIVNVLSKPQEAFMICVCVYDLHVCL